MNIGVFFGSRNPEHDVSIITGELIISGLKKLGHNVVPVYIDKTGSWHVGEDIGSLKFFQTDFESKKHKYSQINLDLEKSVGKMVFKNKGFVGKEFVVDLAFPAFHGANGEDGTFQGLCELLNVPYVGCDVASSAIAMDKVFTKLVCQSQNIPTPNFVHLTRTEWEKDEAGITEQIKNLKSPWFIKPARLGSSIGISKAWDKTELKNAVEVALHYDEKVLVEEAVENLADVTCAVLGNSEPQASLIQESVFGDNLLTYEDKYLKDGGAQLGNAKKNIVIPAELPGNVTPEIQAMAIKVFKALGCSGIARVDFLFDKASGKYFVSEVNTLPGTLYHHLWKASGIELDQLLTKLLDLAKERYADKQKANQTFNSDLMKFANSIKLQIKPE